MNNKVTMECELGGRTLTIETGRMAKQADGSVLVSYGDTLVLVTATAAKEAREGQGFFPLTVDYVEKYYAAGRFPGGFFKREARPSSDAALSARLIDRPIRPLFPEGYMCDVQVQATILSVEAQNMPDVVAAIGASCALCISDIPFTTPIAEVRVGRVDGELKINPSSEEIEKSDLEIIVAGTEDAVVMVEGSAQELSEDEMLEAIMFAHTSMQPVIQLQKDFQAKVGKPTRKFSVEAKDDALTAEVGDFCSSQLQAAFSIKDKLARYSALDEVKKEVMEKFASDDVQRKPLLEKSMAANKYNYMRAMIVKDQKRLDARTSTQVRPIESEINVLPRCHGSSLFTRGETQVLAAITLGTKEDQQIEDGMLKSRATSSAKRFMLHYNFPPFSVGEARPLRPPGRREIGHGMLAERALSAMMPSKEDFPYTIRVVCETLESNGSSSMASVCSGSMALMSAGVPLKKPLAGIAMGLIKEGDDIVILSDILGDEDHLGDMDFKIAGTTDGITAIQMDIKIDGVTKSVLEKALHQAKEGRLHILGEMAKTISAPKEDISKFAPRVYAMKVAQDKIATVIGPGGKVIRGIIEECDVKVDISDDGSINIVALNSENANKAKKMIEGLVEEVEVGKVYNGKVVKIVDFGAFVSVTGSTEGLLHISEIAYDRVNKVTDVLSEGEQVEVKVLDIDRMGKVRLSRKALLDPPPGYKPPPEGEHSRRPSRDSRDNRGDRGDRGGSRGGGGSRRF